MAFSHTMENREEPRDSEEYLGMGKMLPTFFLSCSRCCYYAVPRWMPSLLASLCPPVFPDVALDRRIAHCTAQQRALVPWMPALA